MEHPFPELRWPQRCFVHATHMHDRRSVVEAASYRGRRRPQVFPGCNIEQHTLRSDRAKFRVTTPQQAKRGSCPHVLQPACTTFSWSSAQMACKCYLISVWVATHCTNTRR